MDQKASDVLSALNKEVTRLTGKKTPAVSIKDKAVSSKPSTPYSRPVGVNEKRLPSNVNVRFLHQPGELEGGTKRATDLIWSDESLYTWKSCDQTSHRVVKTRNGGGNKKCGSSKQAVPRGFPATCTRSSQLRRSFPPNRKTEPPSYAG